MTSSAADTLDLGNGTNDLSGGAADSVIRVGGPGTLLLRQSSDYIGDWSFNSDITQLGATSALGTAPLIMLNGGALARRLAANTTFTSSPAINVSADSILINDRIAAGSSVDYTFGPLTIGPHVLNATTAANVTSGTGRLILGAATLTGNSTFNVTNGATAPTELRLAALNDGGAARTITKLGNGALALSAAATSVIAGTSLQVNGGTATMTNAAAFGAGTVAINTGGLFLYNGATATITNPITLGGGTLAVGTANQTYSGGITVAAPSSVSLRDLGTSTTVSRTINHTGQIVSAAGKPILVDSIPTLTNRNQLNGNLLISNVTNSGTWVGGLSGNSGTVIFNAPGAVGTGPFVGAAAGKISFTNAATTVFTIPNTVTLNPAAILEYNVDATVNNTTVTLNQTGSITVGAGSSLRLFRGDGTASPPRPVRRSLFPAGSCWMAALPYLPVQIR